MKMKKSNEFQRHSDLYYKEKYDQYLDYYQIAKNKNRKMNLPMVQKKYSYQEFVYFYEAAANDIDLKKRKTSYSKFLAERQRYDIDYSKKQKEGIRKRAKRALEDISSRDELLEKLAKEETFDLVEYLYQKEGWDGKTIGQKIFGSP